MLKAFQNLALNTRTACLLSAITCCLFLAGSLHGQSLSRFRHLSRADGLSSNAILDVLQDEVGFLWIGTANGLNRYDGVRIKTYLSDPGDEHSLPHSQVNAVFQSADGSTWIGTHNGLALYDQELDRFLRFSLRQGDDQTYVIVHNIEEDKNGRLWLSTWNSGLLWFDPTNRTWGSGVVSLGRTSRRPGLETQKTVRTTWIRPDGTMWISGYYGLFQFDPSSGRVSPPELPLESLNALRSSIIFSIVQDDDQDVWISSYDGIFRVDAESGDLTRVSLGGQDGPWNTVNRLLKDSRGTIWVGTENGLAHLDPGTAELIRYYHNPSDPESIARGSISTLYEDRSGVLWVGSKERGLSALDLFESGITTYTFDPLNPGRFPSGHIWDALEADNGSLWLATTRGLMRWYPSAEYHEPIVLKGNRTLNLPALLRDSQGVVWIGSEEHGLCRFDERRETCTWLDSGALPSMHVYALERLADGRIGVGTFEGLALLDPSTMEVDDLSGAGGTHPGFVLSLFLDRSERLWIGAENGLFYLDESGDFVQMEGAATASPAKQAGPTDMVQAVDGRIWFADGKIRTFDPASGIISAPVYESLLPSDEANGLSIDSDGRIWVMYDSHLASIEPKTGKTNVYGSLRGSLSLQNWIGASISLEDGRLLFGFEDGLYLFHPSGLSDNPAAGEVMFTYLRVNGNEQTPGPDRILTKALSLTKEVVLKYDDRIVEIGFASSHYGRPHENQYRVKLENFSDTWTAVDNPSATYTNLAPGRYILKVVTTTPAGRESAEKHLVLLVMPPWWLTTWFRLAVLAFIVGVGVAVYKARMRSVINSNRRLESLVASRTRELDRQKEQLARQAEELLEANRAKTRFFSNVSHELKTPLTLIRAYLDELKESAANRLVIAEIERVDRSLSLTERLDSLVLQLLELARSDAGRLQLHSKSTELCQFIQRIVTHFSIAARARNIQLILEMEVASIRMDIDPVKVDQIVSNLIENAIKFTSPGGKVWVTVSTTDPADEAAGMHAKVTVADTGPGISTEDLTRIFDRFYQVGEPLSRKTEGLGLGLSLSRDFAVLHNGDLNVSSEIGRGSVFTLTLPIGAVQDGSAIRTSPTHQAKYLDIARLDQGDLSAPTGTRTILIAEDNAELRTYLEEALRPEFLTTSVSDGMEAWHFLTSEPPDIVLSDIMMPGMDGLQLLERVRSDERLARMPFVLLTARSGVEDELAGIAARADDFVAKPFNAKVLKARLLNLVSVRESFSAQPASTRSGLSSEDRQFLDRLHRYVESHIGVEELGVKELADATFMSVRSFQRKIKQVTNTSAAAYVRILRIEHARKLLEAGEVQSVSQAARRSGFQNVSYFSKVFADSVGVEPSILLQPSVTGEPVASPRKRSRAD